MHHRVSPTSIFAGHLTPRFLRRPAAVIAGIFCLSAVALPLSPWRQSASGVGKVIAFDPIDREVEIEAPIQGRIERWLVVEGQEVSEGDVLAVLGDVDPQYIERLERAEDAAIQRLQSSKDEAEAYREQQVSLADSRELELKSASLKLRMAEQKINAAQEKIRSEEANRSAAKLNFERVQVLYDEGLSARRDLEIADRDYQKSLAGLSQARASLSELEASLLSLQAERLQKGSKASADILKVKASMQKALSAEAKVREELTKIESQLARQASRTVVAPRSGSILRILKNERGGVLKVGEAIAVLIPNSKSRAVEIWIDGNDAPLITKGRAARLQFEGWPAVQFVGWPSVAVGTFGGEVVVVDAIGRRDGKFRVMLKPDESSEPWPDSRFLRQGVKVKAWVLLESVPLGYEFWRQLNGFPASLGAEPEEATGKKP